MVVVVVVVVECYCIIYIYIYIIVVVPQPSPLPLALRFPRFLASFFFFMLPTAERRGCTKRVFASKNHLALL